MSKLILYEWTKDFEDDTDLINAKKLYKSTMRVKKNEKVFVFGNGRNVQGIIDKTKLDKIDAANINIVKKSFGLSEPEKRFKMRANYIENIDNGNNQNRLLSERVRAIEKLNNDIAKFFLEKLDELTWDDIKYGIASTIPVDEAFDLIKPAFMQLREILMAGVEDKYSSDLSLAEMKNIKQAHDLNVEQSLGSNLKTNKKSKKK